MTIKISIQEMLDNALHFGHATHRWNPKVKPYIYTKKNGIYIFNLHKTAEYLQKALEFLTKSTKEGKKILLVGTKPQAAKLLSEVAKRTKMFYVTHKWYCGLLTNFATLKKRIKYYNYLKELFSTDDIKKYTKKEQLQLKKELEKLELGLGGVTDMRKLPDIVFVVDACKDRIAIREAKRSKKKIVAILDTNADPEDIDYPIPANDDALKSLTYIITKVGEAIEAGQQK